LLPLLKALRPEFFCFLVLIWTVAVADVVPAVEWTWDWRDAVAESPGFRTHIANMARGGG
jgi:hypothetical protein